MSEPFHAFSPTLQIDREGFLVSDGLRLTDKEFGQAFLGSLKIAENGRYEAVFDGRPIRIESFDHPILVVDLKLEDRVWIATGLYEFKTQIARDDLKLDLWDRVCGRNRSGIPCVLSRSAQARLFDEADGLTDETITFGDTTVSLGPWLWDVKAPSTPQFWSDYYRSDQELPWELENHHPALEAMLKQMKPPRSRISVFGCGGGHDAAYLAKQAHLVRAYDFSAEAIALARRRYGNLEGIEWMEQDVLSLPRDLFEQSDIVIEHTLFCAISPARRRELVQTWTRALVPSGYLVGIFFVMDRQQGPPYGATEHEVYELLKKDFRLVYWNRWKQSVPKRDGIELAVVAQKKE